jgi:ATP-dependent helicase/nuclease subunit B
MGSMGCGPTNSNMLEAIRGAGGCPVVLRGPAASGKTSAIIDFYLSLPPGRCMLLAPNARAGDDLKRRIMARSSGILIRPEVITFGALAGRIVAAGGKAARVISPVQRRLLIRRVVALLNQRRELRLLGPLADTPGLVNSLDAAIAELKRAGAEPQALARAAARTGRQAELLKVYQAYQQHLVDNNLYDADGLQWEARRLLDEQIQMQHPDAIAADGFIDFSPTQLAILAGMSRRGPHIVLTLPYDEDGRSRMWRWTARTLNGIRRQFGANLQEIAIKPEAGMDISRQLADIVFQDDAPTVAPSNNLRLIAACSRDAEVRQAATVAKRLLLDGAKAGEIAVVVRSLETYGPAIGRIFTQCGVPVSAAAEPLASMGVICYLLDVMSLAPNYRHQDVLAVIKSSYFNPAALGDFGPSAPAVAEMIIRWGNVVQSRAAYSDAAGRFANRQAVSEEDDDQAQIEIGPLAASPQAILSAGKMLEALFDLALSAANVSELAGRLGVRESVLGMGDDELVARDLRALCELESICRDLSAEALDAAALRQALGAVSCPPPSPGAVVDVMDALDARSLRYKHVILLGATEGQFPRSGAEGALISEGDRRSWSAMGLALDSRGDLTSREMLLFYLAVSRADESLTVGFMEADSSGRASQMSSFLENLLGPMGGIEALASEGRVTRISHGRFVPPADEICSPSEAMSSAIAGLFNPQIDPGASALAWVVAHEGHSLRRICAGLIANNRRWTPLEWNAFDGWIDQPPLQRALQERFGGAVFSCSQLNTYGQCPWRFFAQYVLNLSPLEQPQRRLEPVGRGGFCHDVLFGVMKQIRDRLGGPFDLADVPEDVLRSELESAVAAQCRRIESRRQDLGPLWPVQLEQMKRDLWGYLKTQRRHEGMKVLSTHFELPFGMKSEGDDLRDATGSDEPVTIQTPSGDILLRGKIDRVDDVEAAGLEGLLVVDYKQKRVPHSQHILEGVSVQAPLYALAAEIILGRSCLGGAYHSLAGEQRWFAAIRKFRGDMSVDGSYPDNLRESLRRVGESVQAMQRGEFPPRPFIGGGMKTCPPYCPYRMICHYSPARQEVKLRAIDEGGDDDE